MQHFRLITLLPIVTLFLSGSVENNRYRKLFFAGSVLTDTSIYDVRFSFTGYQSFNGDATDCPIRPSGTVVLKGMLKGLEELSGTDDVSYSGILQLDMDIDICSAKGEGDNAKPCSITVTGSGLVKTELEIYYAGRGGYIQIKDTTSRGFRKNAGGTCEPGEINEERQMIPLKTIATIFNGLELPMLNQRTLRAGPPQTLRIGDGQLVVHVIRKIR